MRKHVNRAATGILAVAALAGAGTIGTGAVASAATAGPATQLVVTTQPPGSAVTTAQGGTFAVAVSVEDAGGNVATTSAVAVKLALTAGTGTAGATLSCFTDPVSASAGVASFMCSISAYGTGYTLTATSPGLASATSKPLSVAAPVQGDHPRHLALYVDTVEGSGGNPKPAGACAMTNLFIQGQQVVFRAYGDDLSLDGVPLTPQIVKSAYVVVPGAPRLQLTYGAHGASAFWSAPWMTTGYTLGVVNFRVVFVTQPIPATKHRKRIPSQSAEFSQQGLAPSSMLTIVPAS